MKLEDLKKRLKEINDEIAEILDTLNNEGENNDGEDKNDRQGERVLERNKRPRPRHE